MAYLAIEGEAQKALADFTVEHPEYSFESRPFSRGLANYVVPGHCGSDRVVAKYFREDKRKQIESGAMRYWQNSGLVPRLLNDRHKRLIVMSRLAGTTVDEYLSNPSNDARPLAISIGETIAEFSTDTFDDSRLPTDWFDGRNAREFITCNAPFHLQFDAVIRGCRHIVKHVGFLRDHDYSSAVDQLEQMRGYLMQQQRILYLHDFSPGNVMVSETAVSGVVDLEIAWDGPVEALLGAALNCFYNTKTANISAAEFWSYVIQGFECRAGTRLTRQQHQAIHSMAHYKVLIGSSRWFHWNGEPLDAHDPKRGQGILEKIRTINQFPLAGGSELKE